MLLSFYFQVVYSKITYLSENGIQLTQHEVKNDNVNLILQQIHSTIMLDFIKNCKNHEPYKKNIVRLFVNFIKDYIDLTECSPAYPCRNFPECRQSFRCESSLFISRKKHFQILSDDKKKQWITRLVLQMNNFSKRICSSICITISKFSNEEMNMYVCELTKLFEITIETFFIVRIEELNILENRFFAYIEEKQPFFYCLMLILDDVMFTKLNQKFELQKTDKKIKYLFDKLSILENRNILDPMPEKRQIIMFLSEAMLTDLRNYPSNKQNEWFYREINQKGNHINFILYYKQNDLLFFDTITQIKKNYALNRNFLCTYDSYIVHYFLHNDPIVKGMLERRPKILHNDKNVFLLILADSNCPYTLYKKFMHNKEKYSKTNLTLYLFFLKTYNKYCNLFEQKLREKILISTN